MLILSRKPGEALYIGDDILVQVVEIKGRQVRLAFDVPANIMVRREEREPSSGDSVS